MRLVGDLHQAVGERLLVHAGVVLVRGEICEREQEGRILGRVQHSYRLHDRRMVRGHVEEDPRQSARGEAEVSFTETLTLNVSMVPWVKFSSALVLLSAVRLTLLSFVLKSSESPSGSLAVMVYWAVLLARTRTSGKAARIGAKVTPMTSRMNTWLSAAPLVSVTVTVMLWFWSEALSGMFDQTNCLWVALMLFCEKLASLMLNDVLSLSASVAETLRVNVSPSVMEWLSMLPRLGAELGHIVRLMVVLMTYTPSVTFNAMV